MYGSVHYLDIIARSFDELLKKLLDLDANLTITMHMQTMDPVKAIKMLKGALTNIQKMKIEEGRKKGGKVMTWTFFQRTLSLMKRYLDLLTI